MDGSIEALLTQRGAAAMDHPGGTLLAHLARVSDTLAAWGLDEVVVDAGAAHALYGTDGFATALAKLSERPAMALLLGPDVEALVYRYGSTDRAATYPSIGTLTAIHVDRFTQTTTTLEPLQHRAFVDITIANELDVLAHSEDIRQEHGPALRRLLEKWAPTASAGARSAVEQFCAQV